jgi:hypothetical protein
VRAVLFFARSTRRVAVNAHVLIALEEIAKEAGAVLPCEICGNYDIIAYDDDAEAKAYATATNDWKQGAYRTTSLEEVRSLMKAVLQNANRRCPSCDRDD